ncbi:MAG: UDP-N-acetylglucosamine 2-epimerase (non-hydrolyzing) [Candidatus Edwardsbacteria bacterium]|nr:UDP-N-acetylglucosamine 2-epimerase (non-hydrolyzing) [Candidatus Edwardsbacteria bacterium]
MKVLTVIGARPQFIKAAPLSRALRTRHREVLVHTGQHYDHDMSRRFFREMRIPAPDHNLGVGSGTHAQQTGAMMVRLEELMVRERPDAIVIFGDTNSTAAAALSAAKLGIPIAHVEAGMRSFNRAMPEEVNRVVADHVATLRFCSTPAAVRHLRNEGIVSGVFLTGDIMADALRLLLPGPERIARILRRRRLEPGHYVFVTIHRAENTDRRENLRQIAGALIGCGRQVVFPVHPRTRGCLERFGLLDRLAGSPDIALIPPVGYAESLALQSGAHAVLTDSGGLQKEAYLLRTPCVTARTETEWTETVASGWNTVTGPRRDAIIAALRRIAVPRRHPAFYGRGDAAGRIVRHMERALG